jgi:hypothetical protein
VEVESLGAELAQAIDIIEDSGVGYDEIVEALEDS